ncbi:MAG: amino acid synthesis family protein [Actinomycetota bacterium]
MTPIVRDRQLVVRRTLRAAGAELDRPHRHGSTAAVVENPFAGRFATEDEIAEWMTAVRPLADEMAVELRDALTVDGDEIHTYGKGAIVGVDGELEIAAAWHVPAGAGLRAALGNPRAQVPSSKKVGALGSQVDIPLVYLHASYLRSHYDVEPVVVPDGPRPAEVVYALVMSTGARPAHRIGGFTIDAVQGDDGLR